MCRAAFVLTIAAMLAAPACDTDVGGLGDECEVLPPPFGASTCDEAFDLVCIRPAGCNGDPDCKGTCLTRCHGAGHSCVGGCTCVEATAQDDHVLHCVAVPPAPTDGCS